MPDSSITRPEEHRRLDLEGCFNFRDAGGYPTASGSMVRWQRLYRSDGLFRLSPADIERLQALQLATLIDLRSEPEVALTGPPLAGAHLDVSTVHIPFSEDPTTAAHLRDVSDLGQVYIRYLDQGLEPMRRLFEELARPSTYPVVISCAAGKDRTGVAVAVVLRSLGVEEDLVAADYGLTDAVIDDYIATMRGFGYGPFFDAVHPNLLRAKPESMRTLLRAIDDRFGSIDGYLRAAGVTTDALTAVREALLEPGSR